MDKIKLKPCPFCGVRMAIEAVPEYNMKDTMYFLVGHPAHAKECLIGAFTPPRSYDKTMLVEYWNRRADNG